MAGTKSQDEEDDLDLQLARVSNGLLDDLRGSLPRLLRNPSKGQHFGRVHSRIRRRDLDSVIKLIEPFQGDPQLLDAHLKTILPCITDAYTDFLERSSGPLPADCVDCETGVCILLYTLCKVRGYKVIVGFLNNEPRFLEPILERLESVASKQRDQTVEWQVPHVLLLWLSHLLLAPFDLATISNEPAATDDTAESLQFDKGLPPLATRILRLGFRYLPTSTKAQDAAGMLLVRLITRPDMQKLRLADDVVSKALRSLKEGDSQEAVTVYASLGPLRVLAGVVASADLSYLIPAIYRPCLALSDVSDSAVATNAVAKKLLIKILRNISVTCLHLSDPPGNLASFLQVDTPLEDTVDLCLRSLADRSTPVRHAAAKALSHLVLNLDPEMGHEVLQAVLDTFKEDMPQVLADQQASALDYTTANSPLWHGLTLSLAQMLFKRSASTEQLSQISVSLVAALQFEQRAATGNSIGANVRDAGNFGIWAVARRYTTDELLRVDAKPLLVAGSTLRVTSVIQILAAQLMVSACLDPEGNVRRGSSAALQELVGRHPNQVSEGISLVQIVDYHSVSLRRRAMVDISNQAASLDQRYWDALLEGLLGWRGLCSPDVASREAAAAALTKLNAVKTAAQASDAVLARIVHRLLATSAKEVEELHGFTTALACLLEDKGSLVHELTGSRDPGRTLLLLQVSSESFSPRLLRSELPAAIAKLVAALCQSLLFGSKQASDLPYQVIDTLTTRLLARSEESIRESVPAMCSAILAYNNSKELPLGCLDVQSLCKRVATDSTKSTLQGAGGALALGCLAPLYLNPRNLQGACAATAVDTLVALVNASNVDCRIVAVQALKLAVEGGGEDVDSSIASTIIDAVHRGLNDYTIDQRGDVGSLVRLQAISCTEAILAHETLAKNTGLVQVLHADIYRLAVEKLDRVRLAAAHCRNRIMPFQQDYPDVGSVSSSDYFQSFSSLGDISGPQWRHKAVLAGSISCAGISSESLLQAARPALARALSVAPDEHLATLMTLFLDILKEAIASTTPSLTTHPALELLSYLLDTRVLLRLGTPSSPFSWLNLLSLVQKSHHRSPDIPKILAAVRVYGGLAEVPSIRAEVIRKLTTMLGGNPYPVVRGAVAETLWVVCGGEDMQVALRGELMNLSVGDREAGKKIGERVRQVVA